MSKTKNRIPEDKLIKALAELESVAKGDALEEQDPEGGLSTEGKPLSDDAPKGRGESTKKSRRASASSPFEATSSAAESSDDDDDDESSDEETTSPPKKDKKSKVEKASKASKSSSAASSDDEDDDSEKSFREMADGDEKMRKGILINDFLESMVDQMSLALLYVKDSIVKSINETGAAIIAGVDERIAKSDAGRRDFDARMARATAAIGKAVHGELLPMVDMVKSLADQPAASPRGKAVLSKGEVNQPPWGGPTSRADGGRAAGSGDGGGSDATVLRELPTKAIADWLAKGVVQNRIDQNVVFAWEADRYDPTLLPPTVQQALAEDLLK